MRHPLRFLLCLILGVVATVEVAQSADTCPPALPTPTAEMFQNRSSATEDHGFLWRITKNGHSSFLYGTIHVGKPDWVVPGPQVLKALGATNTMALELDTLDEKVQANLRKVASASSEQELPAALRARFREQAERLCIAYDTLAPLAPAMQIALLTALEARWDGMDPSYAIDAVMAGMGHGTKKTVISLESVEFQFKVFSGPIDQDKLADLETSLDELESGRARALFSRIAKAWERSDYAELDHYADWCNCLNTPTDRAMMKRMLDDRNPAMARRIDALHRKGQRVFVAVGSLHMFGSIGLPSLLKQRGYAVERIELAGE